MAMAVPRPARRRHTPGPVVVALTVLVPALLLAGCAGDDPDLAAASLDGPASPTELASQAEQAPRAAEPEPLVTAAPDRYSEVGDLVDGFPIDLLPVPSDAVILVTSAAPVGDADVQEVSLNLRTSATAEELLELYRSTLTAAGFTEVTSQTSDSDLAVDVTFVRSGGDELVSIGVLDVDGARTLTIGGRIRQ